MPPTPSLIAQHNNVCTTPACHALGDTLKSYVNLNVDPCSDFFQYTCGSWLKSDSVKEQEETYLLPGEIQMNSLDSIVAILNGSFGEVYQSIKTKDTSYHTQDQMAIDKKNFQMVKDYYNKCLDTETNSALGATPLFPIINNIENIFASSTSYPTKNLANVLVALTVQEIQSIVNIQVVTNPLDHDYKTAYIGQPDLDASVTYTDIESLKSYQTRITKTMSLVLGGPADDESDYGRLVMKESQKSNFTLWSASKIDDAVKNFINFETQLSALNDIDVNEIEEAIHTFNYLQETNPTIDWNLFFSMVVSNDYVATDPTVLFIKDHIEQLDVLLNSTTAQTIQDYLTIRTVLVKMSSLQFPDGISPISTTTTASSTGGTSFISSSIFRAPTTREPSKLTVEEKCGAETSMTFKNIVGRFFVLKTFGASKELKKVEDFVDSIHDTWLENLPKTSWVDDKTRAKIIEKIQVLRKKVAYSTTSPDWKNPSSLETYYEGLTTDKQSYFDAVYATTSWKNIKLWKTLEYKVDTNEWYDENYPELFNAHYYPDDNTIEIPIGILQKPLYHSEYPKYLNYGSIGSIIGHELVHALDSSGRFYNASGYKEDWFTKSAGKIYDKKSQCFIDQFNNFTLTGPNNVQLPLDGNNTLAENIADSGGLSIAFNAYQSHIKKMGVPEKTLPGFEKLTPEQLFFISHGLFTCSIVKKGDAQMIIDTDVHAPLYFRSIGLFQNNQEFAKAFNCPAGSPMNSHKKCSIW